MRRLVLIGAIFALASNAASQPLPEALRSVGVTVREYNQELESIRVIARARGADARSALARLFATRAREARENGDYHLSARYALAGWRTSPANAADHRLALGRVLHDTGESFALRGHQDWIAHASFSPDTTRIVTASYDNTARIWDAQSGREILVLRGHDRQVSFASFSPGGDRVVTGSWDHTSRVWDAATGREVLALRGHTGSVESATFSHRGDRVVTSGGSDGTARLWSAATGELIHAFQHGDAVRSASFNHDGSIVVTQGGGVAKLWSTTTMLEVGRIAGALGAASFSADGTRLAAESNIRAVTVWDVATRREIATLRTHYNVRGVSLSPDARQALIAGDDGVAHLWDVQAGREVAKLRGHSGIVMSAAFDTRGARIVTAGSDRTARVWSVTSARLNSTLHDPYGIEAATFAANDAQIVTARGRSSAMWDAATSRTVSQAPSDYPGNARYVRLSRDGQRFATASDIGADRSARVWDVPSGHLISELRGHTDAVLSVAFSADGVRVATASQDRSARLWDAASGRELHALSGHGGSVGSVAFSRDGRHVATGDSRGVVRVWDVQSGHEIVELAHNYSADAIAFSPDGERLVVGYFDSSARVWDLNSQQVIAVLSGHERQLSDIAFSPDGEHVLTASYDRMARVWDATSGRHVATFGPHEDWVESASFSASGDRVLTQSGRSAQVWDVSRLVQPIDELANEACANLLFPAGRRFSAEEIGADPLIREVWLRNGRTDRDVCEGVPGAPRLN